jgi:hypothetical protein
MAQCAQPSGTEPLACRSSRQIRRCWCPLPHWLGGGRVRAPKPSRQTFGAHHTLRHRGSSACHADAPSHPGIFPKKVDALSALAATGASPRAVTWHLGLLSGLAAAADEV